MKKLLVTVFLVVECIFMSTMLCSAEELAGAEIIAQDDNFVPQFTTAPDSSLKEHHQLLSFNDEQAAVFYTQTTALALIAGYLILFKVKGIGNQYAREKFHRKRR